MENNCSMMELLPPEVFYGLLDYLHCSDIRSVSLTSTHFNRLCLDRKYLEKEQLVLEDCILSPDMPPIDVFMRSERIFPHFKCTNIEINDKCDMFWRKFAPYIKSLKLKNCSIPLNYVTSFFSYMSNLEHLELLDCRDLFICGTMFSKKFDLMKICDSLKGVKTLVLDERRYLSDALFRRFLIAMPFLNSLSLIGCYINFHDVVYQRYYGKHDCGCGSDSVLTFIFIISRLQKAACHLKALNFSCTKMNDASLKKISLLNNLHLTEICLARCVELTNSSVIDLVKSQKSLLDIDISNCNRLTDRALFAIIDCLPGLKSLNISGCCGITNLSVSALVRLRELNKVSMKGCKLVDSSGIEKGLCTSTSNTITYLDLRSLSLIPQTLIDLSKVLTRLVYLDLGISFQGVSYLSLHAILENLRQLQHLNLEACVGVTDYALCGVDLESGPCHVESGVDVPSQYECTDPNDPLMRDRYRFKCKQCSSDLDHFTSLYQERSCLLTNLKGLRTLDLNFCSNVTDITLKFAIRSPELRVLRLGSCSKITDVGLLHLSKNNPAIEILDLSLCTSITDQGVANLSQNLPRLRRLSLRGDEQLSINCLKTLRENCKALKYLNVSRCNWDIELDDLKSSSSIHLITSD